MEKFGHVVKLIGKENYEDWIFQVKLALRGSGVFGVIDGSLEVKEPGFAQKNDTAMFIIGSTVGPAGLPIIREQETAKSMWSALALAFDPVDEFKRMQLNSEFWSFKAVPGEGMLTTISRLNNLVLALGRQKESISNATKISRLLSALPHEYSSFASAWDSTPAAEKSYEKLTQRLLLEEERRGPGTAKASEALSTRTRQCTCVCTCGANGTPKEPVRPVSVAPKVQSRSG